VPEPTGERPLDSINRTLARVVRLSSSRSAFAQQAAAAGVPITQPSYLLLRIMIDGDGVTMGELARLAHMDLGMATRQVKALVEDGLVRRQADPSDGRVIRVQATAEGQRLAAALQRVRMDHLQRALAGWSDADLRTFDGLLTRFAADTSATSFD
jgi:DNA-binding MarR family transcriptional regulator